MNGSSYRTAPSFRPRPLAVTAALCWWNERPDDLERCVRGVAGIADRIVALDGAYRRYPGATPRSHASQARRIAAVAADAGLDCLVLAPDRLWAGQVEKRSYLLNVASTSADWIVTLDTDHVVHADGPAVRAELARAGRDIDVYAVPFHTPLNPDRSVADSAPGRWHMAVADTIDYIPQIYRTLPGLRVEDRHWWYSAVKNGQRVWVWAGDDQGPKLPHHRLSAEYRVEHRCLYRTPDQILASRAFLNDRDMIVERTGQEDHVDGLPEPVFDYVRLPA